MFLLIDQEAFTDNIAVRCITMQDLLPQKSRSDISSEEPAGNPFDGADAYPSTPLYMTRQPIPSNWPTPVAPRRNLGSRSKIDPSSRCLMADRSRSRTDIALRSIAPYMVALQGSWSVPNARETLSICAMFAITNNQITPTGIGLGHLAGN